MSHNHTRVDLPEMESAAGELGRLARRVDALRDRASHTLVVSAAGADEVSVAVAKNVNAGAESLDGAAGAGAQRLRDLAGVVAAGSRNYAAADDLDSP
ncbi:PE family protein [Jongsikchunia kroppenstedtii]|uniref:PE family protein n=1 Tax=Jongsikchunia kroppenstedtii TaxID=1121721 RepID=UPI0003792098|nr:PE family protein [Jongsikchunia kroppenstedtii]